MFAADEVVKADPCALEFVDPSDGGHDAKVPHDWILSPYVLGGWECGTCRMHDLAGDYRLFTKLLLSRHEPLRNRCRSATTTAEQRGIGLSRAV